MATHIGNSVAVRSRRAASTASARRSDNGGPLTRPTEWAHSLPASPRSESPTGLQPLILNTRTTTSEHPFAYSSYLQGKEWIPPPQSYASQRGNYPSSSRPSNRRFEEENRGRLSSRAQGKRPANPRDEYNGSPDPKSFNGSGGNGGGPGGNGGGPGGNGGGPGGNGGGPGGNGGGPGQYGGPGGNGGPLHPGGPYNPRNPRGRYDPDPPPGPGDPDGGDNPPDPPPLGGNLPVPAPRAPLEFRWQFSSKIPYSSLPEWDGKPTTVIQYVSELSYYQLLGDDVMNHLARVAPFRFTGLARTWFNGLTLADRLRCTANMTNFLIFIREQFMHEEWQHDRKLEFDQMYFRKGKDFRYKLPVEWVLRRISYARLLYPEEADFEPLVCSRVLAIRPRSWGTYILTEHSQTIRELLERANSEQPPGEEDKDTRLSSNHFEFFDSDEDTPEAFAADRKRRVPNRSASNNKQSRIEWPNGKTFEGHAFTRNDSQQSRVKPPGSCHLCTSPLHFYRECAHFPMWVAISKRLREQGKRDPKDLHKLDREYEAHVASLQTDESDDSVSNYSTFESSEYALLVRSSFSAAKMFHADSPVSLNRAYRRRFTRGDENKGKGAL
ncbi:hypothetical protein EYR36_002353 [Pleurotus pulmonarius]|nr:hypothetical protein EYR36_002353 [Pleurotus pulmonarius]